MCTLYCRCVDVRKGEWGNLMWMLVDRGEGAHISSFLVDEIDKRMFLCIIRSRYITRPNIKGDTNLQDSFPFIKFFVRFLWNKHHCFYGTI